MMDNDHDDDDNDHDDDDAAADDDDAADDDEDDEDDDAGDDDDDEHGHMNHDHDAAAENEACSRWIPVMRLAPSSGRSTHVTPTCWANSQSDSAKTTRKRQWILLSQK